MPKHGCLPRKASGGKGSHVKREAVHAAGDYCGVSQAHQSSELLNVMFILMGFCLGLAQSFFAIFLFFYVESKW